VLPRPVLHVCAFFEAQWNKVSFRNHRWGSRSRRGGLTTLGGRGGCQARSIQEVHGTRKRTAARVLERWEHYLANYLWLLNLLELVRDFGLMGACFDWLLDSNLFVYDFVRSRCLFASLSLRQLFCCMRLCGYSLTASPSAVSINLFRCMRVHISFWVKERYLSIRIDFSRTLSMYMPEIKKGRDLRVRGTTWSLLVIYPFNRLVRASNSFSCRFCRFHRQMTSWRRQHHKDIKTKYTKHLLFSDSITKIVNQNMQTKIIFFRESCEICAMQY